MRKSSLIFLLFLNVFVQVQGFGQTTKTSPAIRLPETQDKSEPSQPPQTEVQFNYNYESLTNRFGNWQTASLDFTHKFSKRQIIYGSLLTTTRFRQRDEQGTVGIYQPLSRKWSVQLEASASPTHRILPKWSALAIVERSFKKGWNAQAGYRRTNYNTARTNAGIAGVEKYWGNYRAAYTLYINNFETAGTSTSHRFQFNRYYGEQVSSIGVNVAAGREIENLGSRGVLQTGVQSVALSGRHWFNRHWGVNYDASLTRQGEFYARRGINLGLRYRF
jgi:YaiO family outer membrane protein